MTKAIVTLASIVMLSTACAHSEVRGPVAMKISADEAHVALGRGEVEVGDKVTISKNDCVPKQYCKLVKVGEGEVVELLSDQYSVIKAPGVTFEEGYLVEKK